MSNVHLELRPDAWIWSACWTDPAVGVGDAAAHLTVAGRRYRLEADGEEVRQPAEDLLGPAVEVLRPLVAEGLPVRVCLKFLLYQDRGLIALEGEITNTGDQPCALGDLELITQGRVELGSPSRQARAYLDRSLAHPAVEPLVDPQGAGLSADSQGMVTLAGEAALTVGFVTAPHHRPVVRLRYLPSTDELLVCGIARFNGRVLAPGEQVQTGWLVLRADRDPLQALERYGDLIAAVTPPRLTPATRGWCSWYAVRMPISHAFTVVNARVMAARFRDLGMDLMLLDHGWQTGDICGDWDADPADYPGGLEALAAELEGMGLYLGLWIAPTDIARTSRLFAEHPEWMLRDAEGRPATTWRWYWTPYPLQVQLDATQPGARQYLVDTFRRLAAAGARYFKIDFIAACAGEGLHPAGAGSVRGWDPLRCAMQAIRDGAGEAYVRYCQTPALLSTGLADGVYATNDTLDAGAHTWPTLREVFRMSAAEYWLHGRLYNHDACDLSIRTHGNTEECRLRVTMLVLSGSSVMFSDDLTVLPEERLRLMEQSLPGLARAARPVTLFTADEPEVWHLPVETQGCRYDLVAAFNLGAEAKEHRLEWGVLGLEPDEPRLVREFWTGETLGVRSGVTTAMVPAHSVRLYALWPLLGRPQFVGTDLHLSQGLVELAGLSWDEGEGRLAGRLVRAPGIEGRVYLHLPPAWETVSSSAPLRRESGGLWSLPVRFEEKALDWEIRCRRV